ncbi:MAG: C-GCAxxG-C-C family protein [Clostridia bacterium]|nr:C-GCAxxG-C-C family protein [Clostridia bacterium]
MDIKELAIKYHNSGFNCAQSVLCALGEYTHLDEEIALAISAGFGGGIRSGEICGAISGAIMALGLANPFTDSADTESKDRISLLVKECVAAGKEKFGCVRCSELKGDKSNCPYYIAEMAAIAEIIINN